MVPNIFTTMTDDQLAHWHQQDTRIQQLTRDLAASRAATESAQAAAEIERSTARVQLADAKNRERFAAEVAKESREQVRRQAARVLELAQATRALLTLICSEKYAAVQRYYGGEVFRAIQDADEVCRLCEIPFG